MKNIKFVNFNDITTNSCNTGDIFCSPSLYFDFGEFELRDYNTFIPNKNDVCILGGGGILSRFPDRFLEKYLDCKLKIIWGAGVNKHDVSNYELEKELYKFDLVGIRDNSTVNPFNFVPCVSCMHPLFDEVHIIQEDIVIYNHQDYDIPLNYKKINNRGTDIEEKIKFISSANFIITNTYHGMYWSILLGKKVVVYKPFSNRFLYTPFKVEFCDDDNFLEKLSISKQYNLLNEYRNINKIYYNNVKNLIEKL